MAKKYRKNKSVDSPETIETAQKISTQVKTVAQTKAQTKLIEQGIRKGITLYKKQQKEKQIQLNKQAKKAQKNQPEIVSEDNKQTTFCWLPWTLLIFTWCGVGAYMVYEIFLKEIIS